MYLTTETFTLEPENYRPKDIVKYRHLSPSGNRAYEKYFSVFLVLKSDCSTIQTFLGQLSKQSVDTPCSREVVRTPASILVTKLYENRMFSKSSGPSPVNN